MNYMGEVGTVATELALNMFVCVHELFNAEIVRCKGYHVLA